uniref:Myb-like domain-containing protein n=2 Tax=Sar TaxID=2698737 RepID=A0A7S2TC45_PROMC|mmetsp:Transcript_13374/g.15233  ORF Transcript_13374/g.15233 Transcript_13374/m.15233 type:complete len:227 (-) Transcript_13374:211-891(-)|eukprot:CAMPEP_0204824728 /NCGR_PEP_ID=MMETSP1346-20131115/2711_1 /ASSEMBLY_ACC=CAM_ASM_000771 /TAXON_ID=215587 /ORGANISM="Aplanochytrium stocchinoi, Strain GSBS06" /LENGTH=226 /DNA_ID=CAMNT_0051952035 /DNA_START=188 /DNA_END=868 /DNA_ORIENTATION=+
MPGLTAFQNEDVLNTFIGFTFGDEEFEPAVDRYNEDDSFQLFLEEPEIEIPQTFTAFEFEDTYAPRVGPKNLLTRKRKSEDWDSKPLEKKCAFDTLARSFSLDKDLTECSDRFVDMLVSEQTFEKTPVTAQFAKQKRTRWINKEIRDLWMGIEKHGNNWRAINKNFLTERTYYQVKDKGRRLLASEGWISGRSKVDTDEASDDAKIIGQRVNKRFAKLTKTQRRRR